MKIPRYFELIEDKDTLTAQMQFVSLFIAMYETLCDYVESNVKYFLCNWGIENGKEILTETSNYKTKIKNRIVDEKGNKNVLKASFLFLADNNLIGQNDVALFEALRKKRNKYVHEMFETIWSDIDIADIDLFFQMLNLYKKIAQNWFSKIEAPTEGILPEDYQKDGVETVVIGIFEMTIMSLFGDNQKIKDAIDVFRNRNNL